MTLCLLAGTSAFAQDRRAPRTKERPTAEQMAQRKTDRMVEKLNLNEDQSKQLYELNLQEVKDMQAQHERMRAARKAQAEKMQKILTPEQFEQWKTRLSVFPQYDAESYALRNCQVVFREESGHASPKAPYYNMK